MQGNWAIHNVGIILLVFSVFSLMIPFSQTASAQVSDGTVDSEQKISATAGGLTGPLSPGDAFGRAVENIGDLDGDGVNDLAVGATGDDDGANDRGAVYILFMNSDGTIKSEQKISDTAGGFSNVLIVNNRNHFGSSIASLGDLDGAGPSVLALAVGAIGDDSAGQFTGAVYILFLNSDGTVLSHTKITNGVTNFGFPLGPVDVFGGSVANMGDIDGDGVNDLAVGAGLDDEPFDSGAVYIIFLNSNGTVKSVQKLANGQGGLPAGQFVFQDIAGRDLAALGDLNGDGVPDLAMCALNATPGDPLLGRGKLHMLFLNNDGTVKPSLTKLITSGTGGFTGTLENGDQFCYVENIGDINGDGVNDLAVGAGLDDDGGVAATCFGGLLSNCNIGAVWIVFLNSDGTVNGQQKISSTEGGFTGVLDNDDQFGISVAALGDLNGDGVPDIAVGAHADDDGGTNAGAVWILFLTGITQTPEEATENSIADLADIIIANPGPVVDKAQGASASLETALEELNKDQPDNQAAVGNIEGAIGDIEAAVNEGLDSGVGVELMTALANIVKQLAEDAINTANDTLGSDGVKIDTAIEKLGEGDDFINEGKFKDAASKYKDALSEAEGALP